ncbi:1-acylglycerol-3-phosphate O-acyltransferase [Blochmannia endosymbiont of Camponotus sp. C-003]|uniref:1-acylglycerol-3-phosphate O-acyltransferase n=1 Tax=Blochmannia endosymbiont of Camponotus sp. C-003 TaxID=2945588 RepID=UPI0020252C6B|nr:1-acylglycerol-3-phosphate O-acyltransferase [Blochmannia endosymbiont of Camponotus sp. C-003]URJ23165.1 1-acylglycerol-3-phosphate O-acyltransferase [Blochmannia endosymbiont of Camponotus sp. C-003]
MLAIIRIILILILSISICMFGIIYCLLSPRQSYHTAFFSRLFGSMAPIFGIQVKIRNLLRNKLPKHCIYIANHQNNYDMITVSCVVQPRTIIVGKKNLLWIPLFGQLYWLCGNILINRSQNTRSHNVLIQKAKSMKKNDISIWVFPEGTRSAGRGLLPFKIGAFHAAISAQIPIVPICVSNISNKKIKLNRWSNGLVIIEIMPPIETQKYEPNKVRDMSKYCYEVMKMKIDSLNKEVIEHETQISRVLKTHCIK